MGKVAVLTGGGTAGHIYPALALAHELEARGWEIYYAGTPDSLESQIVPKAGIPFKAFNASGFDRSHPLTLVSGIAKILKSTKAAKAWFLEIRPNVVIGFGGYVSIPVTRAAEELGIPTVVHEQNSVMGMANKYIARGASSICLTYADADEALSEKEKPRVCVTGNPVRAEVINATPEDGRKYLGIPDDATVLLVFGGSKGAHHINEAIAAMKDELLALDGLHVVHITGESDYEPTLEALDLTEEEARRYMVMGYQDHMAETLAAADAIISRAGATSLAEIASRATPAILVPYPYARGDHQTLNARSYASSGAALIVADDRLDSDEFREGVLAIAGDPAMRQSMHDASRALTKADATTMLADQVEQCLLR